MTADRQTTQTSGEKLADNDKQPGNGRPKRSTRNTPHPKYQDYELSTDKPISPPPLPPRPQMKTAEQMRRTFHQLTTTSGPKRQREDSQGGPSYPKEGDKWARREAPKRQLTQETPGDTNDGRHTPSKLIRMPTEDNETGDQGRNIPETEDKNPDMEHQKEDSKE